MVGVYTLLYMYIRIYLYIHICMHVCIYVHIIIPEGKEKGNKNKIYFTCSQLL